VDLTATIWRTSERSAENGGNRVEVTVIASEPLWS